MSIVIRGIFHPKIYWIIYKRIKRLWKMKQHEKQIDQSIERTKEGTILYSRAEEVLFKIILFELLLLFY